MNTAIPNLVSIKTTVALIIFVMTIVAGGYPFIKRLKTNKVFEFPIGEALASGVFLGAGLLHMLADSASEFAELNYEYPIAFLLAGVMFLFLLWLEHLGRHKYEHQGEKSATFAFLATIMLAIHALLAGAALGLSQQLAIFIMVLVAILAHKWAESFALAMQINKSSLSTKTGVTYFMIFACMTPLGVFLGSRINQQIESFSLLSPIFTALAAGTFLYLGTLHGLTRAVLVKKCCNLRHFTFVLIGFGIMAIVAIWA